MNQNNTNTEQVNRGFKYFLAISATVLAAGAIILASVLYTRSAQEVDEPPKNEISYNLQVQES